MIINRLRITAIIAVFKAAILTSSIATGAEQLYTDQPPVTPELAFPGSYDVGVTTVTATDPKRLNTGNFITSIERPLVLEVWYPAQDYIQSVLHRGPSPDFAFYPKNLV